MQQFLGDPESVLLSLEAHQLALAIVKKTLDENCFMTAQKTMDREPPSFKIGGRVYFKNKQPGNGISHGGLDIGLFKLSAVDITYTLKIRLLGKTRSCNIKDIVFEPPVEFLNIDTQFSSDRKYLKSPCKLANHHTQ